MVLLASDHAGFELKENIKRFLKEKGIDFQDLGANSTESTDYPIYAKKMAELMKDDEYKGILICGTGIGMSIAVNRFSHIRGALCKDNNAVELSRKHNNSNVLILAGRDDYTKENYQSMVDIFLTTEFEGGRHQGRLDMLNN